MQELLEFIVKELVDNKESVVIKIDGENIAISVDTSDMGKVIGKQGRIAKAIRTIVKAVGMRDKHKYNVEIVE